MENLMDKTARYTGTGIEGKITGVAEYNTGEKMVLIEGTDKYGFPFEKWVNLNKIEVV